MTVLLVLGSTSGRAPSQLAGVAIGLALATAGLLERVVRPPVAASPR